MTSKEIALKVKAFMDDKASVQMVKLKNAATSTTSAINSSGRVFGALGSMVGGTTGAFGKLFGSISKVGTSLIGLGPAAAVLVGVGLAIRKIKDHFDEAKEKARRLREEVADKLKKSIESIRAARIKEVADAIDTATTKADRAAKAFEAMASANQKIHGGKDAVDNAKLSKDLADLNAKREEAAASPDKNTAERRVADVDVEIAERKYQAALEKAATGKMQADEAAKNDAQRYSDAEDRVVAAKEALEKAEEAVALADKDYAAKLERSKDLKSRADVERALEGEAAAAQLVERETKALADARAAAIEKARSSTKESAEASALKKAEAALENAQNAATKAFAEQEASADRAKAAELEYAAAVENARTEVEKAARTRREIAERQKREAEEAQRREEEEAEARRRKEDDAAAKKDADEKMKSLKADADDRVKKLDQQIHDALRKAGEWDRRAEGARESKGVGKWMADERRRENEEAKAERRRQNNLRYAIGRRDRLQEQIKTWGSDKNREAELKRLNDFIQMQDPKNNPNLKNAEALQRERDEVLKGTKKACEEILQQLKKTTEL